jgi:hypothetical protein
VTAGIDLSIPHARSPEASKPVYPFNMLVSCEGGGPFETRERGVTVHQRVIDPQILSVTPGMKSGSIS